MPLGDDLYTKKWIEKQRSQTYHAKHETGAIMSHEAAECTFHPKGNTSDVKTITPSSGYGPDRIAVTIPKPKEFKRVPDPDETFKPALVKSKNSAALRQAVPSSGYGRRAASARILTPKKKVPSVGYSAGPPSGNPHEVMPKRLKSARRLRDTATSSGYACAVTGGREYRPGLAKRGELAAKDVPLPEGRNPSFQPELFLSQKAKAMREVIPGRRLKPRTGHPGYADNYTDNTRGDVNYDDLYSPYELMKSPERDVADEGASPYGDGFILDGVAAAVRETGLVGNPSNPLSAGIKHGGYVGSPSSNALHVGHRDGDEADVY